METELTYYHEWLQELVNGRPIELYAPIYDNMLMISSAVRYRTLTMLVVGYFIRTADGRVVIDYFPAQGYQGYNE